MSLANLLQGMTPLATCPDPAAIAALPEDCSFYTDCLEAKFDCGPDGYPIGYGDKYCLTCREGALPEFPIHRGEAIKITSAIGAKTHSPRVTTALILDMMRKEKIPRPFGVTLAAINFLLK